MEAGSKAAAAIVALFAVVLAAFVASTFYYKDRLVDCESRSAAAQALYEARNSCTKSALEELRRSESVKLGEVQKRLDAGEDELKVLEELANDFCKVRPAAR